MAETPAEQFCTTLKEILEEYPTPDNIGEGTDFETARSEHPLYQLVVDEAGDDILQLIDTDTYEVTASVGRGSPTFIPYIAVMHSDETTSPQQGRYVVYLFDPIQRTLYLTLNQGAKEAKETAREMDVSPNEILKSRAAAMAETITSDRFTSGPIEFIPPGDKGELYGAGTICYTAYSLDSFPDAYTIQGDLNRILELYEEVISEPVPEPHADDSRLTDLADYEPSSVWIEKTGREGREYKQEGPLALGQALIAPSRDEAGRKRYETLREADIGDIVLHLVQDSNQIVGVSQIASELQEDFEGPPDGRWTEEQVAQGGYKRELTDYTELSTPIDIYDDVLSSTDYSKVLDRIRKETDDKIVYDKTSSLNQGHYFTHVPRDLLGILTAESTALREVFESWGVEIPESPVSPPEPAAQYPSLEEATSDILNRIHTTNQTNWLAGELSTTVIKDWANILAEFRGENTLSNAAAVRLEQIQALFEENQPQLEEFADTLQTGTVGSLSQAETLFAALLRDLMEDAAVDTSVGADTFARILHDEYESGTPTAAGDPPAAESHPLLTYLDSLDHSTPIRKFTAPPDYWLTALRYGSVSFETSLKEKWEEISEGDLIFLHSRSEPSSDEIAAQQKGIFAVGILGEKTTKADSWWVDETKAEAFPYIANFERLFVTSDVDQLDLATPVSELTDAELATQLTHLTGDLLRFEQVQSICEDTNGIKFPAQNSHGVFRDHDDSPDHERPWALLEALADRLSEISTINTYAEFDGELTTEPLESLYFPNDQATQLIEEIEAGIATGKHIILTGPPGTGKTEIARRVSEYLVDEYPHLYSGFELTTATADWSTFDTVGGYMPEEADGNADQLGFTPGVVLNRLKDQQTKVQRNEPVIIDELNRADIDKAFGQLFTLLSGQAVTLPFTRDNKEIELLDADQLRGHAKPHQFVVPDSWRIFATMNTYDKTSLYEMSYAFMRRFAFIRVGAPPLPESREDLIDLLANYADQSVWDIDASDAELAAVGLVWRQMNTAVEDRAIGPAIVKDMLESVCYSAEIPLSERLTRAIISYIFPQLEGVPKRQQILKQIATVDTVDTDALHTASTEMLQVGLTDNG